MKTVQSILAAMCVGAACLSMALPTARAAAPMADDATANAYKALAEKVGPTLVTVKFVMKVSGMGEMGDEGRDSETSGVIIESDGLVLVSNVKMGGMAGRMGMQVNPTDIKILQGDDTEGLKGKILARDTELDLCWIKIDDEKAKGKSFPAIDLGTSATASLGDRLLIADRMGKFFDRAIIVEEARVGGLTRKPRALIVPVGLPDRRQFATLGMPMFTADGKVVGINILQMPGKEDMEGGGEMGEGNAAVLILPAAEVLKATVRGKEMAAKAPAEEPKKEEPKTEEPKKEDDKK